MGLTPLMLWIACLLVVRNQRILTALDARQADNARRAAAGLPPQTRRRRRKTLAILAAAARHNTRRHPSRGHHRHPRTPDHGTEDTTCRPEQPRRPGNQP